MIKILHTRTSGSSASLCSVIFRDCHLRKPSFKKIKKIMENSIIGLTPPSPPPFWPKLWKILKNINYFMASKSGLVLK